MIRLARICFLIASASAVAAPLYAAAPFVVAHVVDADQTAPADDPAVAEGRDALGARFGGYNWYDRSQDASRRVDIYTPWDWSWEWSGPNPGGLGAALAILLKILAWVLLVALVCWLAYLLIRAYLQHEGLSATAPSSGQATLTAAHIEALPEEVRRDVSDLLGAARRHYEQGNYREAMIYLYSHELVELDRGQRIRLARGKTNRQYLRETSSLPSLAELFERAIVTFEAVFFGNYLLDRAGFEACWNQLPEVERLARGDAA